MKTHIVLFGAGKYAKKVIKEVRKYFIIDAICDNNVEVQGEFFENKYKIISSTLLKKNYEQDRVLVAVDNKDVYENIYEQVKAIGLRVEHINEALLKIKKNNREDFYIEKENKIVVEKFKSTKRKIFVLTAPAHSNLGDHAQSYCIETILKNKYPGDDIYIFDEKSIVKNYYELLFIIKQQFRDGDSILVHSGYRLTNLYMVSENIIEMIGKIFKDNRIIFLPQTINYTDKVIQTRAERIIRQNAIIMCRDRKSLNKAKNIFSKSQILLYPDIVTSLIGRYKFNNNKKGILLVMRDVTDGESIESNEDKKEIMEKLRAIAYVDQTDTTIDVEWEKIARNREYYVLKEIGKYSQYQLIITNRFHGTIFALAANTPVIVMPTKDHKVVEGVKWFKKAGYKDCFLCKNKDEVLKKTKEIIKKNKPSNNSDYFYQQYYKDFSIEKIETKTKKGRID